MPGYEQSSRSGLLRTSTFDDGSEPNETTANWRSILSGQRVNVGSRERLASIAAGAALTALGVKRRDLPGVLMAAAGGAFVLRGTTGHCMLYEAFDVNTSSPANRLRAAQSGARVTQSFLVNKTPEELYAYWRNLENLSRVMTHLESVRVIDDRRSHWIARPPALPLGRVEWDAEIVEEQPNRRISWQSLPGSAVHHRGSVEFIPAPGDRGTAIHAVMEYLPPAGPIGRLAEKLMSKALSREIREDLRNFKRQLEAGEVPTTVGQPRGTCLGRSVETSRSGGN